MSGSWDKCVISRLLVSASCFDGRLPTRRTDASLPLPSRRTAKVWKNWQLECTLKGHEQSVWAVLALDGDDDLVLTGSSFPSLHTLSLPLQNLQRRKEEQLLTFVPPSGAADNLIRLFKGDKLVRTFKGHTQAVRALAKLDSSIGGGDIFASGSNDGCTFPLSAYPSSQTDSLFRRSTIRLWSLSTGDCVKVLNGHDSFVYSLSAIPDSQGGGLVSGGEDRTVRVWRASDGECEQTIVVPAVSGTSRDSSFGFLLVSRQEA